MALIRKSKLRDMTVDDLKSEYAKAALEYHAESAARAGSQKPKNAGRYKALRRLKARILTLLSQKGVKQPF
ncbi:MAG: 50S ribosomal protein L29 [Candidatus Micrarchaeota archaeon]|nr:50S ribosomal protein L29 [Candidatus Micrarchaeota archaeon]